MAFDTDAEGRSTGLSSDRLVVELYGELRAIAGREHRRAGAAVTLQPTVLLGEAYLKLRHHADWADRRHFLASAATAMRHILIDAARARLAGKRAGARVDLDDPGAILVQPCADEDIVRLGDTLADLGRHDPQLARLVDCRFFVGLDEQETAEVLGVSDRTVRRLWTRARAWIHAEMNAP
jgi:RNA polymerase sigma factor (TIGR02999 family)